jgi:hypothetical protein
MIVDTECPNCHGGGLQHSPGCNGDPHDAGVACEVCKGAGVVEYHPEDEVEDWMEG